MKVFVEGTMKRNAMVKSISQIESKKFHSVRTILYTKFVPVLNPEKDKRFKTAQENKFKQNEQK